MKKRVLSLALTLVMLLGLLPGSALAADDATTAWLNDTNNQLYVGDTLVTAANADDILSGVNQGKASFAVVGDVPTLTLKGANITTPHSEYGANAGISSSAPLTIKLEGDNTVAFDAGDSMAVGISTQGDLTITDSGSLKVSVASTSLMCIAVMAQEGTITVDGSMTIQGSMATGDTISPEEAEIVDTGSGASIYLKSNQDAPAKTVLIQSLPPHSHPVCGETCSHADAHSAVEFQPLSQSDFDQAKNTSGTVNGVTYLSSATYYELAEGNYYLNGDITLNNQIQFPDNAKVNLCLNGHKIQFESVSYGVFVGSSNTFRICDCQSGGEVANPKGGLTVNGTANLYGGTITSGSGYYGIKINAGGTVEIIGGSVESTSVAVYNTGGTVNISGGSLKSNNTCINNDQAFDDSGNTTPGTATVSGGSITSAACGIQNYSKLTVTGGTITATGSASDCYGICNESRFPNDGTLTLSGAPAITGHQTALGLYTGMGTAVAYAKVDATGYTGNTLTVTEDSPSEGAYAIKVSNGSKDKFTLCDSSGYQYVYQDGGLMIHKHSYGEGWQTDADNHWHVCSCGGKSEEAAHSKTWDKDANQHWETCGTCGWTGAKANHAWDDGSVTTDPSCTTAGVKTFTCTQAGCGQTKTEEVTAAGHTLTKTEAVDATCTTAGNSAYWTCSVCRKVYSDATGATETTVAEMTVAALGHDYSYAAGGNTITQTCSRDSSHTHTLTLNAPTDLTYDGTAKEATLSGSLDGVTPGAITYGVQGGEALSGAPVNAGSYTAGVTAGGETASVDFTITKAAQEAPDVTVTADAQTTDSITLRVSGADSGALQYSKDGGTTWQDSPVFTGLTPGTAYGFTVRLAGDDNRDPSPACAAVTIYTVPAASADDGTGLVYDYQAETVTAAEGYEISTDGGTAWISGPVGLELDGTPPTVQVRKAQSTVDGVTVPAGAAATVTLPGRPAAPTGVAAVNETVAGLRDGKLTGVTGAMEYSADNGATWTACTGTEITGLASGSYQIRTQATDAAFAGAPITLTLSADHTHSYASEWTSDSTGHWHGCSCGAKADAAAHSYDNDLDADCNICGYTRTIPVQPDPAQDEGYSIDYAQEKVTVSSGYEINTKGDGTGEAVNTGATVTPGSTLYIRKSGDDSHQPSGWVVVTVPARPGAPEGLTVTAESVQGKGDGKITGVTEAMEYSADGGATWTACGGTELTGLTPGAYQVRAKATLSAFAGEPATVTVAEGAAHSYTLKVTAPAFDEVYEGYAQPEAQPITIQNSGNSDAAITDVSVSEPDKFTVGGEGESVPAGGSIDTWTIQPAADLSAGVYTATITVTHDGETSEGSVTFTVNALTHNWTWDITTEPTMDAPGEANHTCPGDEHHAAHAETGVAVPALSDTAVWTEDKTKYVEPTETEDGSKTYTSEYGEVTVPIPATGHAPTHTVSGAVTEDGAPVPGATVTLKQGNAAVASTTTDSQGKYSFDGVAPGDYNVVTTLGDRTVTIRVTVVDADATERNLVMPTEKVNSVLVVEENTPAVVVDGLDGEAQAVKADEPAAASVTVTMTVTGKSGSTADHAADIKTAAQGRALEYLEIKVEKTVDDTTQPITTTRDLMTVIIPFDSTGKFNVAVYRYHGSGVDTLTAEQNRDGEYIQVGGSAVTLYVKNFSTYAIGYTQTADLPEPPAPSHSGRPRPSRPDTTVRVPDKVDEACPKDESCPIHPFSDADADAWYHDGVHFCLEEGLMIGTSQTAFEPETPAGRAMIAAILWRLRGSPAADCAMDYPDVAEDAWYTEAVRWATGEGIVKGYGNGSFGPDDPITREQLAAMLWRCAKAAGQDVSVGEDTNILSYVDVNEAGEWAIPALQWAAGSGVMNGKAGGLLDPQGQTSRAEAATMIQRYIQSAGK